MKMPVKCRMVGRRIEAVLRQRPGVFNLEQLYIAVAALYMADLHFIGGILCG